MNVMDPLDVSLTKDWQKDGVFYVIDRMNFSLCLGGKLMNPAASLKTMRAHNEYVDVMGLRRCVARWCALCLIAATMIVAWEVGFYASSVTHHRRKSTYGQDWNVPRDSKPNSISDGDLEFDSDRDRNRVKHLQSERRNFAQDLPPDQVLNLTIEEDSAKAKRVQSERQDQLQRECQRLQIPTTVSGFAIKHMLVIEKYKLVYCFIPKVGCSNWKRIMMVMDGQRENVDHLTSNEVHINGKFKFLSTYAPQDRDRVLREYEKFVFVRQPFERLLSVYKNKLANLRNYRSHSAFHRFGRKIIQRWRPHASDTESQTGENVTWSEFVQYLTHEEERKKLENDFYASDHWREMYKICTPCGSKFDFIGHLETVSDDSKYLLRKWGVEDKVRYLGAETSRPTNSSDISLYESYFTKLQKEELLLLWDIYKNDFTLFGFPKPWFVPPS